MPTITLIEYHNQGGKDYSVSGATFTFDPDPKSLKKEVSVTWRIRKPGFEKKMERARFRYNEKIEIDITGSCSTIKRDELEWYAKRDSLFKISGLVMKTYHAEETDDCPPGTPDNWEAATEEDVFLIFEEVNFTQREAQPTWFDYSIKMRRVSQTRH